MRKKNSIAVSNLVANTPADLNAGDVDHLPDERRIAYLGVHTRGACP